VAPWPRINTTGLAPSERAVHVADLENRRRVAEKSGHVKHRPEARRRDDAERDDRRRMAVDDGADLRPGAIDLGVDEALEIDGTAIVAEGSGVEIEGHDIRFRHQPGRHVAGQQEGVFALVVAHADMAEAVDDALVEQDAVGGDEILDQRRRGVEWRSKRHGFAPP
jgi:hypothetical protein